MPALLLIVAAVIVVLWIGGDRPAEVRTAVVEETGGTVAGTVLNASGYVTARRQATVSSKVTGKVVEVRIEEGMIVGENARPQELDINITKEKKMKNIRY